MILADPVALQYSARLEYQIKQQILSRGGKISFAEYMQQALYAPGLGYYNAGSRKFGPHGDFITAPELGSLFAKCMSVPIQQTLENLNAHTVLELGAGSGQFACDLLLALSAHGIHLENYCILELSPDLRQRQQDLILQKVPQYKNVVHWLDQLPVTPFSGVIFANEVMDAIPVARFYYANNCLQEYYVAIEKNQFVFVPDTPSTELHNTFIKYAINNYISQPYSSDINLYLSGWIKSLNNCLSAGMILLCDYGFLRAEYYHPQRNQGTLMCHYKHRCHDNPFINIGLQDITAHVDFTAVMEAAHAYNLEVTHYSNLATFLLSCGLCDFVNEPSIQQTQEINTLTSPAEMGELFKCIALKQ